MTDNMTSSNTTQGAAAAQNTTGGNITGGNVTEGNMTGSISSVDDGESLASGKAGGEGEIKVDDGERLASGRAD